MDFNDKYNAELAAFETTYRDNICGMVCYACKFVAVETANDIVQNTFLKLWQKDRSFFTVNDPASRQMYLYTCVRNSCHDYLKHVKVTENHSDSIVKSIRLDELNWFDRYIDNEEHSRKMRVLNEQISNLSPKCKEIFELHYIHQKTCPEIASMMSLSVRTVESHIYKALQTIRKNIIDKDI